MPWPNKESLEGLDAMKQNSESSVHGQDAALPLTPLVRQSSLSLLEKRQFL